MGFKLKHVFKGPAKVLNAIGKAGIFGQRGNHFRILGIKVGKDLVPVVQAVTVIATTIVAGPAMVSTFAITEATATICVAATSNGVVTGLSGGNESQVTKAVVQGAATAYIGNLATAASTIPEAVTIHVAGNTAVNLSTGSSLDQAIITSLPGAVGYSLPGNVVAQYAATTATGALLDDNALRGGLQSLGIKVAGDIIQNTVNENQKLEQDNRESINEHQKLEQDNKHQKSAHDNKESINKHQKSVQDNKESINKHQMLKQNNIGESRQRYTQLLEHVREKCNSIGLNTSFLDERIASNHGSSDGMMDLYPSSSTQKQQI